MGPVVRGVVQKVVKKRPGEFTGAGPFLELIFWVKCERCIFMKASRSFWCSKIGAQWVHEAAAPVV